jgi:hypothetical protein
MDEKGMIEGEKPTQLMWQIQFLVKDCASQTSKNFYRVLLYSGLHQNG